MQPVLKADFHHILPDCIEFLPSDAMAMLESAIKRTPMSLTTLEETLARMRSGHGDLYLVKIKDELVGVLYLHWYVTLSGVILNIPLLGGKQLKKWKDDLRDFIRTIMVNNKCKDLFIASRAAWARVFPELKTIGRLYAGRVVH